MSNIYRGSLWRIDSWVSGFANNSYLITCEASAQSVIVDTPEEPLEMIAAAEQTDVQAILITHNHWDHIEGFDAVTERFNVPVGIGANDAEALEDRSGYSNPLAVNHDTLLQFGNIRLRCIATPGHTDGSTCYMLPAEKPNANPHLFTGDTLFPGGPGRTRSAEALSQILDSIASRLHTLPSNTVALPGHGDRTTIADSVAEARNFPYWSDHERPSDLFGDVAWNTSL